MIGDHNDLHAQEVPEAIMQRLAAPHCKERPRIPFAFMISYDGPGALHNIRYFENGTRHCRLEFPFNVYFSTWTAAIVVTFVPLSAIRNPHVLEWYGTFYEVPVDEAKARLVRHPQFPYDGRSPYEVTAQHVARGGAQALIEDARRILAERGIDIPSK